MTIVVTWFRENQIYMIADAAITDVDGNIVKLNQLKLIPHPTLNAGISWYGRSKINGQSTTSWINSLIQEKQDIASISEFAQFILQKVDEENIRVHSGIQISGYEADGTPKFHHITNNHQNDIVTPDVHPPFIDSAVASSSLTPDSYVVNGVGYPFKIILGSLKGITNFESYMNQVVDSVKFNFFQKGISFNFCYDNSPRGYLNKILLYLHITQWLHLYSEQPDYIGGKYSTLIIHKTNKEFDPNGNKE